MKLTNYDPLSFRKWIIDVERSVVPGTFCFCPIAPDEKGADGVVSKIQMMGTVPPNPDSEVIGFMFTGPQALLDHWMEENAEWLEQLNLRRK